ncbi:MAG: hypothetical protein HZC04_01755 [Candidatus Lloydbacteria bacterium]|nr:hypothetical protein [Candidatus Lloydbacteria bacterium]
MATNQETEIKKSLHTALKELGLLESEANLYLTSLTLGPTSIAILAEHLNTSRPNVYKAISGLEKHRLAKFSEKKRYARIFVVEPPTLILELLQDKRETMANLDQTLVVAMPELLANYHQGETPTKIRVYDSREQWMKIFFQILDEAKESIKYLGSADDFIGLIGWNTENEWIKKRKEKGIHIDCLLTSGEDADTLQETDAEGMRTTKIFKGSIRFVTGFMLYANKVIIWQPKAPLLVLIEDEYIVAMFKSIFEVLWKKEEKINS